MMRTEIHPIKDLIVIQACVNGFNLIHIQKKFDIDKWNVPLGVFFHDELLVGDGTHRLYDLFDRGFDYSPISILETDEDVKNTERGAFKDFNTINEFIAMYTKKPLRIRYSTNIHTVIDIHDKKEVHFDSFDYMHRKLLNTNFYPKILQYFNGKQYK